jgi:putative methyltransferase (TIGR04325 family)
MINMSFEGKIKNFLKLVTPPIVLSVFRQSKKSVTALEIWSGDYTSWTEAQIRCTGYENGVILEKCKNALLKIKNGEAVYERDSVLFDEIQYSWGLLAGLQRAALENNGKLCVLDFGGSLGSTYYQNREFLGSLRELQWCIVEQQHFVDCGRKHFEDDKLKFYSTIEGCLDKHKPDVLLLSGVLQYLEKPYEWIVKFVGLGIPYIIIDRTSFVEREKEILTVQNVPDNIYQASYPAWFFNESNFKSQFKGYSLLGVFESYCDERIILNSKFNAQWIGYQFIRSQ